MKDLTLNIYKISRGTHNYYARELRKLHLTMGQFPFIMGIAENDGISQERLSGEIGISKSTTAAIVQQLLNAELVTRETDESDRRNFKLHATEKARALIPEIEVIIARCHEIITEGLTASEKKTFAALTAKVRINSDRAFRKKRETV